MEPFKEFNDNDVCPICGASENKDIVLIQIAGTQKANISQAKQVHLECLVNTVIYYPKERVIGAYAPYKKGK